MSASLPPGRVGDLGGLQAGGLGLRRVPEIALEIGDRRAADQSSSTSSGESSTQAPRKVFIVRWASGVTKITQRAVGGPERLACSEGDAGGADVVGEDLAQLVVAHAADIGGLPPKRGDGRDGVGAGAARDLARRAQALVEKVRARPRRPASCRRGQGQAPRRERRRRRRRCRRWRCRCRGHRTRPSPCVVSLHGPRVSKCRTCLAGRRGAPASRSSTAGAVT